KSVTEIGRELRAGKLLEGSVRKSGNRVRITVQLIDTEGDAHLWSKSYDGALDDVLETQVDIARKIAEALKLPSPGAESRTENPEVYARCLQARSLWNKRTREANDQALVLFQDALRIDAGSARAMGGLALCYSIAADYEWMDAKEGFNKARLWARRAIEVDDSMAEGHLALGTALWSDDWPGAEIELKKTLALNPSSADAHQWYGSILRGMGRLDEALDEAKRAYELDPMPPHRAWFLVVSYFFARRNDESLEVCTRLTQTYPGFPVGYLGQAVLTSLKGDRETAYQNLEAYRKLHNEIEYRSLQARIEAHLGNREEAQRLIDATSALVRESSSPTARSDAYQLSYAYALIGDRDRFFPFAEYLVERKLMGPGELRDPSYENMVGDPRFAALLQKLRNAYGISD
ncbi:MAG TPA: hypothetical protein VEE83_03590, partial [Thermoplasmata archaeon]|nr:hypothetical protein [Thermoplasmata archaeon]